VSADGSVAAMLGDHRVLQPVDGSPTHTFTAGHSIAAAEAALRPGHH
jgi:hypothetical protein